METQVFKIAGVQDTLEVFEDKLRLTPKGIWGLLNKGFTSGAKDILFRSITAVHFKKAGAIFSGYIQSVLPGGIERQGGVFETVKDENAFLFLKKDNDVMEKVKEFIEDKINSGSKALAGADHRIEELTKLAELRKSGAISEKEYEEMKQQIIHRST